MLDLGLIGPAQSDALYHFTGRSGSRPEEVPASIRRMTPQERLDAILREERLRAFPPFGASQVCICFSESPPEHLTYLIREGRFRPWGVLANRAGLLQLGGGSVSYVPDEVYAAFKEAGLEHWAVRTGADSRWMHEREWRLPVKKDFSIGSLSAILVGDASWRPSLVKGWVDRSTGKALRGDQSGNSRARRAERLPRLWRKSWIWVWDDARRKVEKHPPGTLL